MGRLVHSISRSFIHDEPSGINSSIPLAETVISQLIPVPDDTITSINLTMVTYDTLQRFDSTAALHYGLAHGILKTPNLRRNKQLNN